MKIIDVNELKNPACEAPYYNIIDPDKSGTEDPRACGCSTIALLNAILTLKKRLKISDNVSPFEEMKLIQELTNEKNNSVQPETLLGIIDKHPTFNSCRMLVINPNGMNEEVFLRIFLNRLSQGSIALSLMEVPAKPGDKAKDVLNHVSFIHSEKGEVYFDGLRSNLDFLLSAFYFSRPTTLIFFGLNVEEDNVSRRKV
ncbi:MAG: hypothetical protein COT74_01655 [Bdellovibrionales bacterium CG10_big_fil_rev_8_21_14_0_10_45_34]|nr:MAG: hypothetical protein COT74_01655 [Bdellovibrionales bacterium CG10_big_fil_rev_8_21_14_0_10_45_34]